jgi:hypothetical protein
MGGQYRESLSNPPFPRPLPRKNNVTCVAGKNSKAVTIVTCVAYTATPKPARALRRCLYGNVLPARALGALPLATPKPARAFRARAGNAAVGNARDTHVPETHLKLVGERDSCLHAELVRMFIQSWCGFLKIRVEAPEIYALPIFWFGLGNTT